MTSPTSSAPIGVFDIQLALRQARAFLAFGEQVQVATNRFGDVANTATDWSQALQQYFAPFKAAISEASDNPALNPELARLWRLSADAWGEMSTTLGITANALPNSLRTDSEIWLAYQRAQAAYAEQLRSAALAALDLLEQRLNDLTAHGQPVSSLRELYNLWVDCNEETYGQMLRTDTYAELNGRLFNTLLRCLACAEKPA